MHAPASVGNLGPGFDVLGLAVEGLGDLVTVEVCDTPGLPVAVTGRDADDVPRDPARNSASIAARAVLERHAPGRHARVGIVKGLPLAGGLGGSAASAVGGALAAALAAGGEVDRREVLDAAILGERAVSGEALDNLAACLFGGFVLVRDAASRTSSRSPSPGPSGSSWPPRSSGSRPASRGRSCRPSSRGRSGWRRWPTPRRWFTPSRRAISSCVRRALDDRFAEVHRAPWVPHFAEVKAAALAAGALGCSISGAGPTVFALAATETVATEAGAAMQAAFGSTGAEVHVGQVAKTGARRA